MDRFETELDAIPTDGPDAGADRTERLLRRMRLSLHENHYWALEAKRRLVDTYGKKTGMELYKLPMVRERQRGGRRPIWLLTD